VPDRGDAHFIGREDESDRATYSERPQDMTSSSWDTILSMREPKHVAVLLFSYGTLQDKAVQMANFGRHLSGRPDSLPGFKLHPIMIDDPSVVDLSGKSQHMIAKRSADAGDEVAGMLFEITATELAAADRYEVSEYARVQVALKSGVKAWVYIGA
jgi:Gamma-glutamyl cyclotransferase, AIG2-like